jgi:hypothetical protein
MALITQKHFEQFGIFILCLIDDQQDIAEVKPQLECLGWNHRWWSTSKLSTFIKCKRNCINGKCKRKSSLKCNEIRKSFISQMCLFLIHTRSMWIIVVLHRVNNYAAASWHEHVYQTNVLGLMFYSVSSLKQQSVCRHIMLILGQ